MRAVEEGRRSQRDLEERTIGVRTGEFDCRATGLQGFDDLRPEAPERRGEVRTETRLAGDCDRA